MRAHEHPGSEALTTPLLILMAVATGLAAGGNYFNQPLLGTIAESLGTTHAAAAATVTIAQVSYALGLLFLVPLGDMVERRRLIVALMLAAAAGQAISGLATDIAMLAIGTAVAGLFSVAAQVLVPLAATLAAPGRSGHAVGVVMSGLLLGTLLARSVAGLLAGIGGWWTVYRVSAAAMVLITLVLWRALPASRSPEPKPYVATLRSTLRMARELPRLRTRALLGALSFASVGTLFSTMAFLLAGPPFHLSDTAIGLVGLSGVAGALVASPVGRMADRGKTALATGGAVALLLLSWPVFALGETSLVWFTVGMVLATVGLQGIHISNQSIIYALAPEARSLVTAVYMTIYFAGGAAGSSLGAVAWSLAGWTAVVWLGGGLAVATALAWAFDASVARKEAA